MGAGIGRTGVLGVVVLVAGVLKGRLGRVDVGPRVAYNVWAGGVRVMPGRVDGIVLVGGRVGLLDGRSTYVGCRV